MKNRQHISGFTLIELMVTVAIAAIIVGMGVPAMKTFLDTNRRAAAVNTFVTDIQRARSTAASRGVAVVMCTATSATACSGGLNWENGWMLFADANDNGDFDTGDTLLNFQPALDSIRMPGGGISGRFGFRPGFLSMTGNISVAICVDDLNENGRKVVVSNTGRPRLIEMTATSSTPNCL